MDEVDSSSQSGSQLRKRGGVYKHNEQVERNHLNESDMKQNNLLKGGVILFAVVVIFGVGVYLLTCMNKTDVLDGMLQQRITCRRRQPHQDIQSSLDTEVVKTIEQLLSDEQLSKREKESLNGAAEIFVKLEKKGLITANDLALLHEILTKIDRTPLMEKLETTTQNPPEDDGCSLVSNLQNQTTSEVGRRDSVEDRYDTTPQMQARVNEPGVRDIASRFYSRIGQMTNSANAMELENIGTTALNVLHSVQCRTLSHKRSAGYYDTQNRCIVWWMLCLAGIITVTATFGLYSYYIRGNTKHCVNALGLVLSCSVIVVIITVLNVTHKSPNTLFTRHSIAVMKFEHLQRDLEHWIDIDLVDLSISITDLKDKLIKFQAKEKVLKKT